ncbi:hypothetical protein [Tsukamurella soli]
MLKSDAAAAAARLGERMSCILAVLVYGVLLRGRPAVHRCE